MLHASTTEAPAACLSPSLLPEAGGANSTGTAHEIKFLLTEDQARQVEARILRTLLPDPHSDPTLGGMYAITSLACDSPDFGVFFRDARMSDRKYRVRRYGGAGPIFLECKWSRSGAVRKQRVEAPASWLEQIAAGRAGQAADAWFAQDLGTLDLTPVCMVRYLRRALFGVSSEGPMRVTFDRNIRGGLSNAWSMEPPASGTERTLLPGLVVCEFKFNGVMPSTFKQVIADLRLAPTGVSKYRTCVRAFAPELGLDLASAEPGRAPQTLEREATPPRRPGVPDWLRDAALVETPISALTMGARLLMAAGLGVAIAIIYRLSHGRLARDSRTLVGTLVLLTILLAMVTMVIGDSVARAFGLVGALSIVRFRTIVEDTRDTAFVIFAVAVGMAVGTGLVMVAVVGIPVMAAAAIALSARAGEARAAHAGPAGGEARTLVVRLGVGHDQAGVDELLRSRAPGWSLSGVATARQGAAVDLTYMIRLADTSAAPALVMQLNALPGVQSVDLRSVVDNDD